MNTYLLTRITPFVVILLVGCNTSPRQVNRTTATASTSATSLQEQELQRIAAEKELQRIATEKERMNNCSQALESLKEVNPKKAGKFNDDFKVLVSAASQYNAVRNKVADPTKQGIDSMYQFKSIKLCADIEKELIDSLVKRAENTPL